MSSRVGRFSKDFAVVLLLQLIVSLPFYTVSAYAVSISNVRVDRITKNSATILWNTDTDTNGRVNYGISSSLGLTQSHNSFVRNHSLTLSREVNPGTEYFFEVRSSDDGGNTAVDNRSGAFYTFSTLADSSQPNSTPMFLDVLVPRYSNKNSISITGSTKPFSQVSIFVNNPSSPLKVLSSNQVGSSGKFAFSNTQLSQKNSIIISAVDQSSSKAEKTFSIDVDTKNPVVKVENSSRILTSKNLSIKGTVDEPVTLKVFLISGQDSQKEPDRVTGLNVSSVGKNSVELKWDESEFADFEHYVIYRDGVPIALAKPSSFSTFTDALVDSGKTYKYRVSVISKQGVEGQKSSELNVRTQTGGQALNLNYPDVDIFEDTKTPSQIFNLSGRFNLPIEIDRVEGQFKLRLIFQDIANNQVVVERDFILDTKRPEVRITSPSGNSFVYDNAANNIDVVGKTEPNARVHLFVNRVPFRSYNVSLEISGLEREIQEVPETKLEAKCTVNLGGKNICGDGADKSVTADSEGNFIFKNVDITTNLGFGGRIRETNPDDFRDELNRENSRDSRTTTLLVIATDQAKLRGFDQKIIRIGNCWSGNQSWDIISLTQYQSPTLLSTERLKEGTESLYFYFNYSYIGRGVNARIERVTFQRACGSRELMDSRYNISCAIMAQGDTPSRLNPPFNTISYSSVPLARIDGIENFLENDWKSFFKSINGEMTFPFKVNILYSHDVIDETGKSVKVQEAQTTCQEVSYVVDSTLIDPRAVIPDFLLYEFVDFLQGSIKTLTVAQESVQKVLDYVAVGCLMTYFTHTAVKIYRIWTELIDERTPRLLNPVLNIQDPVVKAYCENLIKTIKENNKGNFKILKMVSDPDLKKCFPKSYSAWQKEAKVYELQRWSCDRVFGHSAPARWTETQDDGNLTATIESKKSCPGDNKVSGQPLYVQNCLDFAQSNPRFKSAAEFGVDAKCTLVQVENEPLVYTIEPNPVPDAKNVYEMRFKLSTRALKASGPMYAIKENDKYYLTSKDQTCQQICGGQKTSGKPAVSKFQTIAERKAQEKKEQEEKKSGQNKGGNKASLKFKTEGECMTTEKCTEYGTSKKVFYENQYVDISGVKFAGYTKDCFDYKAIGPKPEEQDQCCCLLEIAEAKGRVYYQPDDAYNIQNKNPQLQLTPYIHESKSAPGQQPVANTRDDGTSEKYSDMKWSYRYWKEKFEAKGPDGKVHNSYNPDRYIEGRDFPACFGQNNLFLQLFGKERESAVVDPFRQHTAALQCGFLTGINQRLQLLKNIMGSLSNCLIQVRENGRADAGVCKELFTQHVCGTIWQAIQFFVNDCSSEEPSIDMEKKEEGFAENIKLGFKGIYQGISDSQNELSQEYGNAKLNDFLGVGQENVARKLCLAAFGYDWNLNAKNLIDAAYTTPFATLAQSVTRSREFLTIDPTTSRPKYEYRASWLINPGCDMDRFDVKLACVSHNDADQFPNSINCGSVGAASFANSISFGADNGYNSCDCFELEKEVLYQFENGIRLKQNQLIDKDLHRVIESEYRYDHVKITMRPDRRIPENLKQNCFPQGYYKNGEGVFYFPIFDKSPQDIADCRADPLSGIFTCKGGDFFGGKGAGQIIDVTINDNRQITGQTEELHVGDQLRVGARVMKTGGEKCYRVSIDDPTMQPQVFPIIIDGASDMPITTLTRQEGLTIQGNRGDVSAPGMSYELKEQFNSDPVTIGFKFEGPNSLIDFSSVQPCDLNNPQAPCDKGYVEGLTGGSANNLVPLSDIMKNFPEGKLKISKNGATIEIKSVSLTKLQPADTLYQSPGNAVIIIGPPGTSSSTTLRRNIKVEITTLKEGKQVMEDPNSDCNFAQVLDAKTYPITISSRNVDPNKQIPAISNPTYIGNRVEVNRDLTIKSKITHPLGIKSVTITILDPNSQVIVQNEIVDSIPSGTSQPPTEYQYKLTGDRIKIKGNYKMTITAVSKADTVETRANRNFDFDIGPQRPNSGGGSGSGSGSGGGQGTASNCKYEGTDFDYAKNNIDKIIVGLEGVGIKTREGIAGVLGNIRIESNFNPAASDQGTSAPISRRSCGADPAAIGIVQWCRDRRELLLKRHSPPSHLNIDNQIEYLRFELTGSESGAVPLLNADKTPEDAAVTFRTKFERASAKDVSDRQAAARKAYSGLQCAQN